MRPGTRAFIWGLLIGAGGMWAYHAFARPLPRPTGG
jgi:hypothetical protein